MKKFITFALIFTLLLTGCLKKDSPTQEVEKIQRQAENTAKTVETITLNSFKPELKIQEVGTVESEQITLIQPEITGRVLSLKVKVGDKVKENQVLATLGNSLSTDIIDINKQSAQNSAAISREAQKYTEYAGIQSMNQAQNGLKMAEAAYFNAYQSLINAQNAYEYQYDQASLALDNAELSYKQAKKAYKNAPEASKSQAKTAREMAENGVEQAEIALDLLIEGHQSQLDQLNYVLQNTALQYQNAKTQIESVYAASNLQKLQAESQANQANQGAKSANANAERKEVKAYSTGTVTKVNVKEDNLVSPGVTIIEIQNTENLIVKTYINAETATLLDKNSKVEVEISGNKTEGKIVYIGSTLDPITKKIEVKISLEKTNLIPGVQVKIYFTPTTNSYFIPLNAVSIQNGKHTVKLNKDGKVVFKEVEIGKLINEYVEITKGLSPKDQIITTTNTFLNEGEEVKTQ